MRSAQRSPTPWRLLIAALAAIAATTASAQADIYLKVTDTSDPSSLVTRSYDLSTNGNTGTNYLNITDFAGYDISMAYNTPSTTNPTGQTLQLDGKVSQSALGGANGSANFRFQLFSSTNSGIGAIDDPVTAGQFMSPSSGTGYLTSSLQVVSYTSGTGVNALTISDKATYTGYGPSQTVSDPVGNVAAGAGGMLTSAPTKITSLSPTFDLSAIAVDVHGIGQGGSLHFTAGATVALPEPSGVVAAFAGLPCMGMLLGFARRFRGRNSQSATA